MTECFAAGVGAHAALHLIEWVLLVLFGVSIHRFIHKWEVKERVKGWWQK